jgi:hypothetical protein
LLHGDGDLRRHTVRERHRRVQRGWATASTSCTACSLIRRVSGRRRQIPIGACVRAPIPLLGVIDRNFIHRATWRPAHRRGLSEVVCPTLALQLVCQAYVRAVTNHTERLARLAPARTDPVQTWRLARSLTRSRLDAGCHTRAPCPLGRTRRPPPV